MTTVASLAVQIGADIAGLTSGLRRAEGAVDSFAGGVGSKLQNIGGGLQNLGGQISLMSAPIAAFGAAGIQAAADFEVVMAQIEAFGGLTTSELAAVQEAALQMGADTMFSASDAAGAMLELTKAGQDVETAMVTARSALDLATVGAIGLESATGIVSTTMSQFGLDADQAGMIVETLAAAANASRADVQGLADGLANVGPVAAQFGLDLTETSAALAIFADAGIEGAEAGTQLKSMLLAMATGPNAAAAFNELGVALYDTSGNMRDFDAVLDDLAAALNDLPAEEQNRLMQDLAGSYGITGFSALLAAGGIDGMVEAMEAAPPAADLAAAQMNTFAAKVDSLKGSVETLMITALTPLMDNVLKPLADELINVANAATEWAKENPQLAQTIGMVAGGLILLGPALMVAGTAINALGSAVAFAGKGLALLISPPFLIAAGMVALLAAGGQLDEMMNDIGAAGAVASSGLENIAAGFEAINDGDRAAGMEQMKTGMAELGAAIVSVPINLVENLAVALGALVGVDVVGGITALRTGLEAAGQAITIIFDNIKRDFQKFFLNIQTDVLGFVSTFRQQILDATGGQIDIAPNISVNLYDLQTQLANLQIADQIEAALGEGFNLGDLLVFETEQGTIAQSISQLLDDPAIFDSLSVVAKDRVGAAVREGLMEAFSPGGDFAAAETLLPMAMKLQIDPAAVLADVQAQLAEFVASGGMSAEDAAAYGNEVLMPLAVALDIPIEPLQTQIQAITQEAAGSRNYNARAVMDMVVRPGSIDLTAVKEKILDELNRFVANRVAGVTGNFGNGSPNADRGRAAGGNVPVSGLIYAHRGEHVLNRNEARDYLNGDRNGGDQYIVNLTAYGSDPYDLFQMVQKAARQAGA